jgi:hypothetical protein
MQLEGALGVCAAGPATAKAAETAKGKTVRTLYDLCELLRLDLA